MADLTGRRFELANEAVHVTQRDLRNARWSAFWLIGAAAGSLAILIPGAFAGSLTAWALVGATGAAVALACGLIGSVPDRDARGSRAAAAVGLQLLSQGAAPSEIEAAMLRSLGESADSTTKSARLVRMTIAAGIVGLAGEVFSLMLARYGG